MMRVKVTHFAPGLRFGFLRGRLVCPLRFVGSDAGFFVLWRFRRGSDFHGGDKQGREQAAAQECVAKKFADKVCN